MTQMPHLADHDVGFQGPARKHAATGGDLRTGPDDLLCVRRLGTTCTQAYAVLSRGQDRGADLSRCIRDLPGIREWRKYGHARAANAARHGWHAPDCHGRDENGRYERTTQSWPRQLPILRYQFGNHLDSACLELDASAAIISYEEYYPYGSTSFQAVSSSIEVGAKRYRYTGKERDEETGLYYHGARYYAPWLGRWTACDPVGTGGRDKPLSVCKEQPCHCT